MNTLYAAEVLPPPATWPARVYIGVFQLLAESTHPSDGWSDLVGGRGRRLFAGAMRWSRGLADTKSMHRVVGALPSFVFSGNKAEVVIFGPESAELVTGPVGPVVDHASPDTRGDEGLGLGIRHATQWARGPALMGHDCVAGVPTFFGDSSVLLLRATHTQIGILEEFDGTVGDILRGHRSAVALSQASRWAQAHNALMGMPSFVEASASPSGIVDDGLGKLALEVIIVRGQGQAEVSLPRSPSFIVVGSTSPAGRSFVGFPLLALSFSTCGLWTMRRRLWPGRDWNEWLYATRAELEFALLVERL